MIIVTGSNGFIGSNLIKITGVNSLEGCNHKIEPDIIEIGSWIGLAALTQSEITIKGVNFDYLEQILNLGGNPTSP